MSIIVHETKTNRVYVNATTIVVVVISEGILKVLQRENEFACFIGYEISHVTLCHGTIEIKK